MSAPTDKNTPAEAPKVSKFLRQFIEKYKGTAAAAEAQRQLSELK